MNLLWVFGQLHSQTQDADSDQAFLKFTLFIFMYFHVGPGRTEISSGQFLLPSHLIGSVHSFSSSRNKSRNMQLVTRCTVLSILRWLSRL